MVHASISKFDSSGTIIAASGVLLWRHIYSIYDQSLTCPAVRMLIIYFHIDVLQHKGEPTRLGRTAAFAPNVNAMH